MASLTNFGTDVVERSLNTDSQPHADDHESYYELSRCIAWVKAGNYKNVCLQFPDELMSDAPAIARALTSLLSQRVYILGDTTYGSCCVDEVAAEHVGADSVIHFGRTCLSPSRRIPVLYVFTKIPVDVHSVVFGLCGAIEDATSKLVFVFDTRCHYIAEKAFAKLQEHFPHIVLSVLLPQDKSKIVEKCNKSNSKLDGRLMFNGREIVLPAGDSINDYQFIFLGPEGPTLTSLLMRFSKNAFYCIDPSNGSVNTTSGVRSVMSRSAKLELAKDSEIIGVLVGTLGVADYSDVIIRLKKIIKRAGKRSYTFLVGKPNEPKLCNIAEVDVFVYVACPETAIVERQTDPALYKKLITPWELEVALLDGQEWSLEFESDFRQLLPGGAKYVEITNAQLDVQVNVSLLSNKTQKLGVSEEEEQILDSTTGAVVLQNGMAIAELHIGGAGEALKNRTWQGLDMSVPAPAPLDHVAEGRMGIASVYADETNVDET